MSFDIDLTSLLAGVSLTAVGGWIASFIAFRKDERAVQLEQITKERTKWRDSMRELCEEIAKTYIENRLNAIPAKVASLRARLATSINPRDESRDGAILAHYDRLFSGESDDFNGFSHRIALLLKHDWERVKWECTPLYVKPFKRFTRKQREWRQENYRETKPTPSTDSHKVNKPEEESTSQGEHFLHRLIDVQPKDVTLKFVFDNIKNYGIAASIMVAGFYLVEHGSQLNRFPGAGITFGTLLLLTGLSLQALNLCQAIWALVKMKMRIIPYFILSAIMFLGTSELLWVLIQQYMHKV